MADHELQIMEQQRLIEQLKAMIRDSEETSQKKDKEITELNAKLSKMKLQAKAKLAKEAKEAKEGKGAKSGSKKQAEDNKDDKKEEGTADDDDTDRNTRAKSLLLKKKIEEKDRQIKEHQETVTLKDQQIVVKEKIITEREEIIRELTRQLEDKTQLMEELCQMNQSGGKEGSSEETEARVQQMYAQIVYKDKNLLEMNNKVMELERRLIDLQEYIGEKNEVIHGRDKVVQILQLTIKDKDQTISDQAMLVTKLTGKVESNDETLGHLCEKLDKTEHDLRLEKEHFNLRLTESQKYFEETLKEQEENISRLRKAVKDKEEELLLSQNDLREIIGRHERDIQKIMSKGEVNIQDPVIQMLEQKLKDTNEVLEGKIKVIEVLQKQSSQKDKELEESREVQKSFKEKLQEMSEKMLLFQANLVDMEAQWNEERKKMQTKISDLVEKHEHELSEKELQLETLRSSASQLEVAYTESVSQYSALQERYQHTIKPGGAVVVGKATDGSGDGAGVNDRIAQMEAALKEKELQLEEYECLKMKLESIEMLYREKEEENANIRKDVSEKMAELEKYKKMEEVSKDSNSSAAGAAKGDAKMLKMKAQLTAKVKTLEKELSELKQGAVFNGEVEALQQEVESLKTERVGLQSQLEDIGALKSSKERLEGHLADLEKKTQALNSEKEALTADLVTLTSERDQLKVTVTQLQEDVIKAKQSDLSESLQNQLTDVQAQLAKALEAAAQFQNETSTVKGKLEDLEKEVHNAHVQINEKQQDIEKAESEKELHLTEIQKLKKELEENQLKFKTLEKEYQSVCSKNEELSGSMEAKNKDMSDFLQTIGQSENDLLNIANVILKREEECVQLNENIERLTQNITNLEDKNIKLKHHISEMQEKHKEENNKMNEHMSSKIKEVETEAEKKVKAMQAEIDHLRQIKHDLEENMSSTQLLVKQQEREIGMLQEQQNLQGSEMDSKMQSLLKQVSEIENKCLELKMEKESAEASCAKTEIEKRQLELSVSKLNADFEEQRQHNGKELLEKDNLIMTKEEELKNLLDIHNKVERDLDSLRRELEETSNSNAALRAEIKSLQDRIAALSDDMEVLLSEKEKLSSKVNILGQEKTENESRIEKFKCVLNEADSLKEENAQAIDRLQNECRNLTDNLNHVKQDLNEKMTDNEMLTDSLEKMKQEQLKAVEGFVQESESLKSEHKEAINKLASELELVTAGLTDDHDVTKGQMNELIKENSDLGAEINGAQQLISELKKQLNDSEETVFTLKSEYEEEVKQLKSQIEHLQAEFSEQVDGLSKELDITRSKVSKEESLLKKELQNIKDENSRLHSQESMNELQTRFEEEKGKSVELQRQLEETQKKLCVSEQLFNDLQRTLRDSDSQKAEHTSHISMLTEKHEFLMNECQRLDDDVKKSNLQLETALAENEVLRRTVVELEEDLDNKKTQLCVFQGTVEDLTMQIESLHAETLFLAGKEHHLMKALEESESKLSISEQSFAEVQKSLGGGNSQTDEHKSQVSLLTDELEFSKNEEKKLDINLKQTVSQLEISIAENETLRQQHCELIAANVKVAENLKNKELQVISLQRIFEDLSERNECLHQSEKEMQCQLEEAQRKNDTFGNENSALNNKIKELETKLKEMSHIDLPQKTFQSAVQAEVNHLQRTLEEKDAEIAKLKNNPVDLVFEEGESDFKDFCQKVEKERDELQKQVSNLQNQIRKKDGRIKSLKKQLDATNKHSVHQSTIPEADSVLPGNAEDQAINQNTDNPGKTNELPQFVFEEPVNELFEEEIMPLAASSLNTSFSSVTSDHGESNEDLTLAVLTGRLKTVTDERNKFKADNKKLLKVCKGKDAKLKIMNDNFEKLRHERDELLAERDSLDNKVQDMSMNQSFIDTLRSDNSLQVEVHCGKLEALCIEKNKEIERLMSLLEEHDVPQSADNSFEMSTLSRENEKLKLESAKLHKIDKGKTAQIMKLNQDYDSTLQKKDAEIENKCMQVQFMEEQLNKVRLELDDLEKEKEQLVANNAKLVKVNKGKDAKVKKYESTILEKEKIIIDKEADNQALQDRLESLNHQLEEFNAKELELREQIQYSLDCTEKWQEQCQNLERKVNELLETIHQKESEIESLIDNEKLLSKLKEEKIILEFELECAKEELNKIKQNMESEEESRLEMHSSVDEVLREKDSLLSEANSLKDSLTENDESDVGATSDLKSKAAYLLSENKKLLQEKNKLQKISKGKDAKLKKIEDIVGEKLKIIAEKETDIVILQESVKDLTSKVAILEEIEEDLKVRLDHAIADVDEWRDHCHDLEDRLDAAHEAIDRKNDELERLDEDFVNCREDLENLKEDYENLSIERDELERSRAEIVLSLDETKFKLGQKENEIAELQDQLHVVSGEKDNLSAEISKLQKLAKSKEVKVKKAEESVQKCELSLNENLSYIQGLEQELYVLKEKLSQESHDKYDIETHMQRSSNAQRELEDMNKSLLERISNMSEESRILQINNEDLELKLKNEIETTVEKAKIVSKLEKECESLGELRADLEKQLFEKSHAVDEQLSKNKTLSEEMSQLQSLLEESTIKSTEQEQGIKYLTDVSKSWENRAHDLEEILDRQNSKIQSFTAEIDELKMKLAEMRHSLSTKENELTESLLQNSKLKQEIEEMSSSHNEQVENLDSETDHLQQILRDKSEQMITLEEKCNAFERQYSNTLSLVQEKDKEVLQSRKRCLQLEQDLDELKRDLESKQAEVNTLLKQSLGQDESAKEYETMKDDLAKLKLLIQERECTNQTLHNDIQSHIEKSTNFEKLIEDYRNENTQLLNNVHEMEQSLAWFRQYYEETQESLSFLNEKVSEQEEKLNYLEQENKQQKDLCSKLETSAADSQSFAKSLKEENENLMFTLEKKDATHSQEFESLSKQLEEGKERCLQVLKEKEIVQSQLQKKQLEINKCLEDIQKMKMGQKHAENVIEESFVKEVNSCQMAPASLNRKQKTSETNVESADLESQVISASSAGQDSATHPMPAESSSSSEIASLKSELSRLKKVSKGKDMKIKKLEEQVKQCTDLDTESLQKKSEATVAVQKEIQTLEQSLVKAQQDREEYLREIEALNAKSNALQLQVHQMLTEKAEYQAEIQNYRDQCQLLDENSQRKQDEIDNISSSVAACQANYDSLLSQSKETEEQLMRNHNVLKQEIMQLRTNIGELNAKYEMLHHKNTENENVIKLKDEELHDLKHLMKQNITELDDLKKTNTLLQQSGEGIESEKQRFEELLKNEREEIQSLYEQMNELVSEKLDLECSLEQKDRDLKAAAQELRKFAEDRDKLDDLIESKQELETEVETFTRDMKELRIRLSHREQELFDQKAITEEKDAVIQKLSQELLQVTNSKQELNQSLEELTGKVHSTEDDNETLRQELHSKKEACSKLSAMCQANNELIESLKQDIVNSTNEVARFQQKCAYLYDEINLYKEQLHAQNSLQSKDNELDTQCKMLILENDNLKKEIWSVKDNEEKTNSENISLKALIRQLEEMQVRQEMEKETDTHQRSLDQFRPDLKSDESEETANDKMNPGTLSQAQFDKEAEVESMRKELMALTDQLQEVTDAKCRDMAVMEEKLHKKDEKIASLIENLQEMEERLSQLSEEPQADKNQTADEIEKQITSLKQMVEEKETKFTKALATAKKLKIQLNQANANLEKEKTEREIVEAQLRENISLAEKSSADKTDDRCTYCAQLQRQIESHLEFSSQLQNQVQVLTEKVFSSESSCKLLEEEVAQLKVLSAKMEEELQEKLQNEAELKEEIVQLKTNLKQQFELNEEKEQMNALLQKDLETNTVQVIQHELNILSDKLKLVEDEKSDIEGQKEALHKKLCNLSEQFNELEANSNGYLSTIKIMQDELKSYVTRAEMLEKELADNLNVKSKVEEILKEKSNMLGKTTSDLEQVCQENKQLKHDNEKYETELEMLNSNILAMREELNHREDQLKSKQEEIDTLRSSETNNDEYITKLEESQSKIVLITENLQEVSRALEKKEMSLIEMCGKLKDKEKEVKMLSETMELKDGEITQLKTSLEEKSHLLIQKQESLVKQEKNLRSLQEDKNALISQFAASEQQLQLVHEDLKSLTNELVCKDELVKTLTCTVNERDSEISAEKEKCARLERQALEKSSAEFEIQSALDFKQNELQDLLSMSQTLKVENQDHLNRIQALLSELKMHEGKVSTLLKENEELKRQMDEINSDNHSAETAHLAEELSNLKSANEALQQSMNDKSSEFETLKQNHEALNQEKQSLFEDLCSMQEESGTLKSNISKANETIAELSTENKRLALKEVSYQEQLQELTAEIETLRRSLDILDETSRKLTEAIAEKDIKLTEVSNEVADKDRLYKQSLEENNSLKVMLKNARLETEQISKELDILKNQQEVVEESFTKSNTGPSQSASFPSFQNESTAELPVEEMIHKDIMVPLHQAVESASDTSSHSEVVNMSRLKSLEEENVKLIEKNKTLHAKMEKMLAKLKLFKERNDNYQLEMDKLKEHLNEHWDTVNKEIKERNQTLAAEVAALQETVHKQKAELDTLNGKMSEMLTEISQKSKQISELQDSLRKKELEMSNLSKETKTDKINHNKEIENLKKANAITLNRVTEILEEIDGLKSLLDASKSSLEVEKKETARLENEKLSILSEMDQCKEKLNEQEQFVATLQESLLQAGEKAEDAKSKMELAQRQFSDFKEQYGMLEQDNQNYQLLLEKSTLANSELKKENIRLKILNEKLETEQKGQNTSANNEELEKLRKKNDMLESEMQSVKELHNSLEKAINEMTNEKAISDRQLSDLMALADSASDESSEELKNKLKQFEEENEELNEEVGSLKASLNEAKEALENSQIEKEGLEDQIANMVSEIFENKMKNQGNSSQNDSSALKQLEKDLAEAETEKEYLEEEMDGLRQDMMQAKKEKEEALQQSRSTADKLELVQHECRSLKNENDSLKWKLDELQSIEEELHVLKQESLGKPLELETKLSDLMSQIETQKEDLKTKDLLVESLSKQLEDSDQFFSNQQEGQALHEQMNLLKKASDDKINKLEEAITSLSEQLRNTNTEKMSLIKQIEKKDKQLQKFDMLKEEYQSLNDEYSKILSDNSELAKQIEELHSKLMQSAVSNGVIPDDASLAHFDRTKNSLTHRVEELEAQGMELRQKNAELIDEKSKLELQYQEVCFARDRLNAQQGVVAGGDKGAKLQTEYETLRQQFNVAMEQRQKLQADLNLSQRSLAQRDARCQQLAMQVSQLVEDRSYLNIQLSSLSKSLREKEQDLPRVQQEYRTLYRSYMVMQAKLQEQEKRAVLDYMQRSPAPSSGSATPREGLLATHTHSLNRRLELTGDGTQLQAEPAIEITMHDRLGEQMMDSDGSTDGEGRIRDIKLTRDGTNSYLGRLQRWMTVPTGLPPTEHVERSVLS